MLQFVLCDPKFLTLKVATFLKGKVKLLVTQKSWKQHNSLILKLLYIVSSYIKQQIWTSSTKMLPTRQAYRSIVTGYM